MCTDAQSPSTAAGLVAAILLTLLLVETGLFLAEATPAVALKAGVWAAARLWLALGAGCVVFGGAALGAAGRPRAAVVAGLATPVALVYAYACLVLPWTQLSFWVAQVAVETLWTVPVVGPPLAQGLIGGFTLSQATLERAHTLHAVTVWVTGLALAGWARRVAWLGRNQSPSGGA